MRFFLKIIFYFTVIPTILAFFGLWSLAYLGPQKILGKEFSFTYQDRTIKGLPFSLDLTFTDIHLQKNDHSLWQGDKFRILWKMFDPFSLSVAFGQKHRFNTFSKSGLNAAIQTDEAAAFVKMKGLGRFHAHLELSEINSTFHAQKIGLHDKFHGQNIDFEYIFDLTSPTITSDFDGSLSFHGDRLHFPELMKFPLRNPVKHMSIDFSGNNAPQNYFLLNALNIQWQDFSFDGNGKLHRNMSKTDLHILGETQNPEAVLPAFMSSGYLTSNQANLLKNGFYIVRQRQNKPLLDDSIYISAKYTDQSLSLTNANLSIALNNEDQPQAKTNHFFGDLNSGALSPQNAAPLQLFNDIILQGFDILQTP